MCVCVCKIGQVSFTTISVVWLLAFETFFSISSIKSAILQLSFHDIEDKCFTIKISLRMQAIFNLQVAG